MKKLVVVVLVGVLAVIQAFACAAITKSGRQCKRAPSPGSQYCWQHGGTTKAQRAAGLTDTDVATMRCKAITKAGTQCKRTSMPNSDCCWQHAGMQSVRNVEVKTNAVKETAVKPAAGSVSETPVGRTQCEATTKNGSRCSRKALPGQTRCWQHVK